jgi:hypothetical protein
MAATILRPEINIPLELKPAYADWAEGNYGPQLKIKTVDGELVFLHLDTMNALKGAGLLEEKGTDKKGNPAYKLTRRFTMTYTKRDKRPADIAIDGKPLGDAPQAPPSTNGAKAEPDIPAWTALALTYDKCAKIASRVWPEGTSDVAPVAATATLFIEANKHGLVAEPKAKPQSEDEALFDAEAPYGRGPAPGVLAPPSARGS